MRLEKGVRVYDECFVGLVRIFILILKSKGTNQGFAAEDQPYITLGFQKKEAAFEVIFVVSK